MSKVAPDFRRVSNSAPGQATIDRRCRVPSRTSVPSARTPSPKLRVRLAAVQECAGPPVARAGGIADVAPGQPGGALVGPDELEDSPLGHRLEQLAPLTRLRPEVDASAERVRDAN